MKFKTELTPNSCRDYLGREGGEDWVRPALHMEIYRDSSLLLPLGLCKAGRALFWGQIWKVRPALRKAGRTFLPGDHFPDSSDALGPRFRE